MTHFYLYLYLLSTRGLFGVLPNGLHFRSRGLALFPGQGSWLAFWERHFILAFLPAGSNNIPARFMLWESQWITGPLGYVQAIYFYLEYKKGFLLVKRGWVVQKKDWMEWWYCWQVVGFFPAQAVMTLTVVIGGKQFGLLTPVSTMCYQGMIPGHVWQTRRWEVKVSLLTNYLHYLLHSGLDYIYKMRSSCTVSGRQQKCFFW